MSDSRESDLGLLGLLGVGMVVCCGLPVLLGTGIAIGAAGLALGSGLVVVAGITVGLWGWRRRQAQTVEVANPSSAAMRVGVNPDDEDARSLPRSRAMRPGTDMGPDNPSVIASPAANRASQR